MLISSPIVCHNCQKNINNLPFKIIWKHESNKCDQCFNVRNSYHEYEFCSSECLKEFGEKFHNHTHQWDIGPLESDATVKGNKIIDVMAYCKICKEQNYHCEDENAIAKWEKSHKDYVALSNKSKK